MTETTLEMWWPHPDAFQDLEVTETDDGWQLSAPDNSELGDWLAFWSQDEAHHTFFEKTFIDTLLSHIKTLDLEHGKAEAISDEQSDHRGETKENPSGAVA